MKCLLITSASWMFQLQESKKLMCIKCKLISQKLKGIQLSFPWKQKNWSFPIQSIQIISYFKLSPFQINAQFTWNLPLPFLPRAVLNSQVQAPEEGDWVQGSPLFILRDVHLMSLGNWTPLSWDMTMSFSSEAQVLWVHLSICLFMTFLEPSKSCLLSIHHTRV